MSHDQENHDHGHEGGHELEAINTKLLFRLMISLSLVTLLASMAVVQWYYSQRSELQHRLAVEGSPFLIAYKEKMAKDLEGIESVRRQILADGKVLQAPPPPPGWVHPDDLLSGGAPAAVEPAPAPVPAPAPDPGIVVEGEPAGIAVPAGEPAKPVEKPVEKPAEPKPAEPKPANE